VAQGRSLKLMSPKLASESSTRVQGETESGSLELSNKEKTSLT
jgi:hypothetical protein